ncbi:carbamoyltransferase C-terminal domain-containing protein [Dactylosporangium sp. CA-139066]|uniref:carbamoyltransferase C-terminal domain-containing protein n=1 Tax=Dactylosporangium sp. CA-139066 TaxID=3239930 RepID=UPI003D8ABBBF
MVFAAHSERYSRVKNDPRLHPGLLAEALTYGRPEAIAWYERPFLKKVRHARARQWGHAVALDDVPQRYLRTLGLPFPLPPVSFVGHHESHAMAGAATSGFSDAAVIVADAIGEFDTFTIWRYCRESGLRRLYRRRYPDSLGLLYSAFTRRCGFRPNEDEYIIMGMAAFGRPRYVEEIQRDWIAIEPPGFRLRRNVHRGIGDWLPNADAADLAASIQAVTEMVQRNAAQWARQASGSRNLVLMGGVALNCVANSAISADGDFADIWIFPNPGDAGSSMGAAAAHVAGPVRWPGPYLGTDIQRALDPAAVVRLLRSEGIVAVANGRAEFGPRALGNRSILADPRPPDMKDRVNRIKGRERFRPFAPVIPLELAHAEFDLPVPASPYMQFTARCREPERHAAVVHVDGTSRVQTVTAEQHPVLYEILRAWRAETGCPMLLNTSLNSRGEPLVNTWDDALTFGRREAVTVL